MLALQPAVAMLVCSKDWLPWSHAHPQERGLQAWLCAITLALHCMGVPEDWRGEPEQSSMLLAKFVTFLEGLAGATLLEAAQLEVTCHCCHMSLEMAAWKVGKGLVELINS